MWRRIAALGLVLAPGTALAHAAERGLILLLPTEYYLVGGALAVAISFGLLALAPERRVAALFRSRAKLRLPRVPGRPLGWAGFLLFWALVAIGLLGPRDPLANPLPLVVWTVWWIGFAGLVALVGDLWCAINPWSAPAAAMRRLIGPPPLALPRRVGRWPAIAGLGAAIWFEIVDIAPDDPARLARAAAAYWIVQFAAMLVFGERRWRARGEAFSVLFRLLGRIAPLRLAGGHPTLTAPGARLVRGPGLGMSGWLFVCLMIAAVTFDGLSATFWWLARIGVNPLEFPGRSAVMAENTLGLFAAWMAMAAAFALAVTAGWALAGRGPGLGTCLGRLALSLLPIALAYHLSHYLTVFLVNGQYALVALGDPLGTGADWLGLGPYFVTTSFLNNLADVEPIWQTQVALIVGGHLLAVMLAHAIAAGLFPGRRATVLSQLPLAALMVAYTALGLWLLATPTSV